MSDSGLNLAVLQNVVRILEVCSQRGVFKAEELEVVGTTFNKVKNFVDKNVEALNKQSEVAEPAAEPTAEPVACDNEGEECCDKENCEKAVNNTNEVKEV